ITDGITGSAESVDRQLFSAWASAAPVMTAAAWYGPPSGSGNGQPSPPPDIMIDALSLATGEFIDDDFVTVTSHASFSLPANTDGWVPTSTAETLQAFETIGPPLVFDQWIVQNAGTPADNMLNVPAGSNGIAIAVYVPDGATFAVPPGYLFPPQLWWMGDPAL